MNAEHPLTREGCWLCDGAGEIETHRASDDAPATVGCPVCIENDLTWYRQKAEADRDALAARHAVLVEEIRALMQDSEGLAGYHLNGEIAAWDEFEIGHLIDTPPTNEEVS